jgi:serine/threonine-protein kinase
VTTTFGKGSTEGFRFVRTIKYAGLPFGKIDLVVGKSELEAAAERSRQLLIGLAAAILLCVIGVSFAIATLISLPIRRLKAALSDAASGKLDFRISHNREDEFGELFDGFNRLAASLEGRGWADQSSTSVSLDATRIDGTSVIAPPPQPLSRLERLRRRA